MTVAELMSQLAKVDSTLPVKVQVVCLTNSEGGRSNVWEQHMAGLLHVVQVEEDRVWLGSYNEILLATTE